MSANPYAPPRAALDPPPEVGPGGDSPLAARGARLLTLAIVGLALCLALGQGFILGLYVYLRARAELKLARDRSSAGDGLLRAALVCGAVAALLGSAVIVWCVVAWAG